MARGWSDFEEFARRAEPQLRRALTAAYGVEAGRDAAIDALAWAWRHWSRLKVMDNPVGYLYRVGQSAARRGLSRAARWPLWQRPSRARHHGSSPACRARSTA